MVGVNADSIQCAWIIYSALRSTHFANTCLGYWALIVGGANHWVRVGISVCLRVYVADVRQGVRRVGIERKMRKKIRIQIVYQTNGE